jgi:hypothetical protein
MATIGRLYYGSNLLIGPSWPTTVERSASTTVTADAVAHTKGAWTELIASTDAASRWLFVDMVSAANATNTGMLLDIGTGASGSETVRIANIGAGHKGLTNAFEVQSTGMLFPLNVASGTRIAARIQAITASRTATVAVSVLTDDGLHAIPTTIDTIGANTAASRGTNAPTSNTYAQVTASTSQAYQALVPTFTGAVGNMANNPNITFTVGTGASGSEQTLTEFTVTETAGEVLGLAFGQPVPLYVGHIPAGTRLAVKQSTGANYRDVILHGVPY